MKPKEFDELIRQKFDQNDFAYKPRSWDSLAEQLEGRAKKRSIMMWWWIPVAGMAASVALAMGSTSLLKHSVPVMTPASTEVARAYNTMQPSNTADASTTTAPNASKHKEAQYAMATTDRKNAGSTTGNISSWFHVRLNEATSKTTEDNSSTFNFLAADNKIKAVAKKEAKKELVIEKEGYNTFAPEDETPKKLPTVSITLLGGYNSGAQNTGYIAGGTIRKMLNDKVYIESDIAFASSYNTQSTEYLALGSSAKNGSAARHAGAKTTAVEADKPALSTAPVGTIKTEDQNYNLYYAQVTPSIGYKVIKRLAIGVGPDFQRMLVDNRPAVSIVDRGNIQVAPLFDVGLVGKTELALTKRIKAGVSYRKGVNNFITPMDKYIDRDYLQFQLRCTILNR